MNKLLLKTIARKILEFLIYGQEYKAPEYAYVRVNKTTNKNIYNDKLQR